MKNPQNHPASDNTKTSPVFDVLDVNAVKAKVTGTVNTLFHLGSGWADLGIGYVRVAAENGARALDRTAKQLETFQARLKKADVEAKPAA